MQQLKHFALTALFALLSTLSANAYDFKVDGIYYNVTSQTYLTCAVTTDIYGYNAYPGDIVIPSSVSYSGKTYSVTSIGGKAFSNCIELTSVSIPNSVTSIGSYAFEECKKLTSLTIPNNVNSIGHYAFHDCTGLTSVTVPNSVTSIGDWAFYGCM